MTRIQQMAVRTSMLAAILGLVALSAACAGQTTLVDNLVETLVPGQGASEGAVATAAPAVATVLAEATIPAATGVPTTPELTLELAQETPILMCTPPACAPGEVYACPSGDCPGGCGAVCAAPDEAAGETPIVMCTPPACAPGEVYACPSGDCPGGCGTVCSAAPAAPAPTPIAGPLAPSPTDWDALEGWLATLWQSDVDPAEVRAALQASGMQRDFNDWLAADFNGDLQDEWALVLNDPAMPGAPFGSPGTLWIVGEGGVVFRYYPLPSDDLYEFLAPRFVGLADMTGDGLPELATDATVCGAHTCYGNYRVIGVVDGAYRDLISREPVGEGDDGNTISLSYPDTRLEDLNEDGRTEFLVHGGTIGSAGAGIVRERTEIWAWDGTAVTLSDTQLDPTEYRHHVLYEANDLMAAGDLAGALLLYETAINDPALRDDGFAYSSEETRAAINQFAAFRLILIDLLQGETVRAASRLEWLRGNYPDSAAAQGAATLVESWAGPDGQAALCAQIETTLGTQENPTGALRDMGYGNPSLSAADYCP